MAEHGNWADLPRDAISLIFLKLGVIEVLLWAQAVCRSWWQVAHEPQVWRCIDMRYKSDGILTHAQREKLAWEAVDRCGGYLEKFYADDLDSDELLSYVADRTTGLRCLVLIETYSYSRLTGGYVPVRDTSFRCVTTEGLYSFVGRCPLLEEFHITICHMVNEQTFEGVIRILCGKLKRLRLNRIWCGGFCIRSRCDIEALEIANNMPRLCELQLIGNKMTSKGLHAILDRCLYLESLDIRHCLNVSVDVGLEAKLSKLKMVRLPYEPITADYEFDALIFDNDFLSDVDILNLDDDCDYHWPYVADNSDDNYHWLDYADNSD